MAVAPIGLSYLIVDEFTSFSQSAVRVSKTFWNAATELDDIADIWKLPKAGEVARFEDKMFPAATMTVFEIVLGKHDPRNPNPAAGPLRRYVICVGDRQLGGEYHAQPIAELRAKDIHQRLVKTLKDDVLATTPDFGRF